MINEIFEEWCQKEHPLHCGEQRENLRMAFAVGAWAAMGLMSRISKLPNDKMCEQLQKLRQELRKTMKLPPEQYGPKVTAYIDGERVG